MDFNNQNFFEWGLECDQLDTDSERIKGVSPITQFSFSRVMIRPQINGQMYGHSNVISGTGEYSFEMAESNTKLRDAFNLQNRLEKLSFIRYLNNNGLSEEEKYTIENAVITEYSFDSKSINQQMQIYRIKISATGKEIHKKLIRDENGNPSGYVVSNGNPLSKVL